MPAPWNRTQLIDGEGGSGKPRSPYVPRYYQQQSAEQQRQAQLIAEARERARQQAEQQRQAQLIAAARERARQQADAAAQRAHWEKEQAALQTAQAQREHWANQQRLIYGQTRQAQQATWNTMNMEPNAPTWRSPAAQQPAPSLQNTLSMEPTAPAWRSPLAPQAQPTMQQTLSMEPTPPPVTYQHHNPFADNNNMGVTQTPWRFSVAYGPARYPFTANVPPPAASWENYQMTQNRANVTQQTVSPTTVPTANVPFDFSQSYFSDYWTNMMNRRDAYGNLVPTGPINEYWEFSDIPDYGYGGGYGGWGGGGGYTKEDTAPFYRGDYTRNKSRWNETLLTWGLRQE